MRYLAIPLLSALLITGATFFVGEFVLASIPGTHGAGGSADVYGFPMPYATFFPCCGEVGQGGHSVTLDNTYYFQPLNFVLDFAVWSAISLAVVSTFTFRRFLLSATAGIGLTLATLLLQPLSIVAPTPGMETNVLTPMGFPYQYLTYYSGGFLGFTSSGYTFDLSPALADYALWTGVVLGILGITSTIIRMKRHPGEAGVTPQVSGDFWPNEFK